MFTSIEDAGRFDLGKRVLLFLLSALGHGVAILMLVILPLLLFGAIQEVELVTFLIAPPAPPAPLPPPVPPSGKSTARGSHIVAESAFLPPLQPPHGIPQPEPEAESGAASAGIPGSLLAGFSEGIGAGLAGSPFARIVGEASMSNAASAPPPPSARRTPRRVGGNVLEGKIVKRVEPAYPRLAVQARVSGTVVLQVAVDEEGNVEDVKVLQGHPLLIEEAVRAVKQWKYSPTLLNGEPVPVVGMVMVIFSLR